MTDAYFQVPYYIDGNVKITQSVAILYYIGRKNNMVGNTEEEKIQVDMLVNEARDMRRHYAFLVYDPEFVSCCTPLTFIDDSLHQ